MASQVRCHLPRSDQCGWTGRLLDRSSRYGTLSVAGTVRHYAEGNANCLRPRAPFTGRQLSRPCGTPRGRELIRRHRRTGVQLLSLPADAGGSSRSLAAGGCRSPESPRGPLARLFLVLWENRGKERQEGSCRNPLNGDFLPQIFAGERRLVPPDLQGTTTETPDADHRLPRVSAPGHGFQSRRSAFFCVNLWQISLHLRPHRAASPLNISKNLFLGAKSHNAPTARTGRDRGVAKSIVVERTLTNYALGRTNSTSMLTLTSSPTTKPPASRAAFQFKP